MDTALSSFYLSIKWALYLSGMWDHIRVSALKSSKENVCALSLLLPARFNILPVSMCFSFQYKTRFSLKTYLCSFCLLSALHPASPSSAFGQSSSTCITEGFALISQNKSSSVGRSEQLLPRPVRSQRVVRWDRNLKLENLEAPRHLVSKVIRCDEFIA